MKKFAVAWIDIVDKQDILRLEIFECKNETIARGKACETSINGWMKTGLIVKELTK